MYFCQLFFSNKIIKMKKLNLCNSELYDCTILYLHISDYYANLNHYDIFVQSFIYRFRKIPRFLHSIRWQLLAVSLYQTQCCSMKNRSKPMEKTPRPSLVRSPVMVVQSLALNAITIIWAMLRIPPNQKVVFLCIKATVSRDCLN